MQPIPPGNTLKSFLRDGALDIWAKWAKPLLDTKKAKPGTIRASLTSLNKFLDFVVDQTENAVRDFPDIEPNTITQSKLLIKRVVGMGSAVNNVYNHEN